MLHYRPAVAPPSLHINKVFVVVSARKSVPCQPTACALSAAVLHLVVQVYHSYGYRGSASELPNHAGVTKPTVWRPSGGCPATTPLPKNEPFVIGVVPIVDGRELEGAVGDDRAHARVDGPPKRHAREDFRLRVRLCGRLTRRGVLHAHRVRAGR